MLSTEQRPPAAHAHALIVGGMRRASSGFCSCRAAVGTARLAGPVAAYVEQRYRAGV
jgi:hypothetical protein